VKFAFVALLVSLTLVPRLWADNPDDQYVGIYNLIQLGDMYYEKGQVASARSNYEDALSVLKKFSTANPDWNVKVVRYRLNYLTGRLTELATPAPAPPVAKPVEKTPPPAAVPQPEPLVVTPKPEIAAPAPPIATPEPKPPATGETAPPPAAGEAAQEYQMQALREQVRRLEGDKVLLEAKLKEALAARPASVDPQEYARSQDMIRELQKENDLLKTSLTQAQSDLAHGTPGSSEKARSALADANKKVAQLTEANAALTQEKEALQARVKAMANPDAVTQALREENEILKRQIADLRSKSGVNAASEDLNRKLLEAQSQLAVLQSDKELLRLEKLALEARYKQMQAGANLTAVDAASAEKIRKLEAQRDELQKSLDAALKEIEGHHRGRNDTAKVEQMTQELAALHSRIEAMEAVRIPYTPEELALFEKPEVTARNPIPGRRSVKELPAEGAILVSEANRFYAAGQFDQAEAKYLEVLKLNDKNIATLANLARVQTELNHLADAEVHIQSALAIEPDNDYSLEVLGKLRFQQNRYDEALAAFSRAAKANPGNPELQNCIGITLSEKGLRGPAETALRRAVQLDPNYANAHVNLAFVYLLQKPPLVELARWHYQKALAAHSPRNAKLEKMLEPATTTSSTQ